MARFVDSVPVCISWSERPINVLVSLAASADLEARFLTSSDTTEKPWPASPARAASTAAFSAVLNLCGNVRNVGHQPVHRIFLMHGS